mgnify:CR=1 FL=1
MFDILLQHNTLVLFGIIFFGIALGSIKIYGLNLGLSGVLFVALAAGHYRLAIPDGVGQLGLALFVYCASARATASSPPSPNRAANWPSCLR